MKDKTLDRWMKQLNKPLKMQKLTWTVDGETTTVIRNEDQIDILVGQLMNTYWNPTDGWTIDYTIKDVKR
jgi:hypothetical protein